MKENKTKAKVGRKTSEGDNKRTRRNVSMSDDTIDRLKVIGDGNVSEGIRLSVVEFVNIDDAKKDALELIGDGDLSKGISDILDSITNENVRVRTVFSNNRISSTLDLFTGNTRVRRLQEITLKLTDDALNKILIGQGWTPPPAKVNDVLN